MTVKLRVNGSERSVDCDPSTALLYVLRNDLELNGAKYGCGKSQCGACTILVDGRPMRSCVLPVSRAAGRSVVTLEGLGDRRSPHPLQIAFLEKQAAQCGYCTSGMIVEAAALLERTPNPSEDEIRRALEGHLCRCGAHGRIVAAVSRAAAMVAGDGDGR